MPVRSLRQPHRAHSAASEFANEFIVAYSAPRIARENRTSSRDANYLSDRFEFVVGLGEERFHFAAQTSVVAAGITNESGPILFVGKLERGRESILNLLPPFWRHPRSEAGIRLR